MAISPQQIKVCAFSYYFPPHFSGAGLQTLTLAKELSKQGVQYFFVTVDNTGLPRKDRYQGFDVYRIADGSQKHGEFVLWWNLWRALRPLKDRFDILHASGSTLRNSGVGLVGRLLGKRSLTIVSMAHNDLLDIGRTRAGKMHAFLMRYVDRYVSLSKQITEEIKSLPLEAGKAVEIPQGVNRERFHPVQCAERAALRKKLGLPDGPLALYAGVFDSRKNVEWLVRTWLAQRRELHGWRLLLVGPASRDHQDADLRDRLAMLARNEGMDGEILIRDFSPQVEEYYQAADIFILPSHNEGMPNVVLEAMSCGLPCVATRISGTVDVIEHGQSGMLFERDDQESFLSAMRPLLADPALRQKIGRRASTYIESSLSSKKSAERYLGLYQTLLEK